MRLLGKGVPRQYKITLELLQEVERLLVRISMPVIFQRVSVPMFRGVKEYHY